MSISTYRSTLERLTRERANLESDKVTQQQKVAGLLKDIGDAQRSLSRTSSDSMRRSYQRRIESKQKDLTTAQKALATIEGKIARKIAAINSALKSLEQVEAHELQRKDTQDKQRRREEERHVDSLTRAAREQARIHGELARSPMVIDLARLPKRITVLFLAADPIGPSADRLRLDEEIRLIDQRIQLSTHRDAINLVAHWAVRSSDLLDALNRHRPHVVHFSGHSNTDAIVLQNPDGSAKFLTKEIVASTLQTVSDHVRLVVFNSCFSVGQAEAVTQFIDAAIGMTDALGDEAARVFAGQLYSSIGFGRSLQTAFDQAVEALKLEGIPAEDTPELSVRAGLDADDIVLVRPPDLF